MSREQERVIRVLEKGYEKLKQGWCQHSNARDANGNPVRVKALDAVCWCILGSIEASTRSHDLVSQCRIALVKSLGNKIGYKSGYKMSISSYQDSLPRHSGKRTLCALLRRTVKRLRKEQELC